MRSKRCQTARTARCAVGTAVAICALAAETAFGGVRTNDYSWVRGTHYGMVGGNADQIARELGYGRRVGLNATRFWLSRVGWNKNPEGYVQRVRAFMRLAWENGYYSMPILFNGNGLDPRMLDEASWPGCFRCRDTSVIIPGLANREGSAKRAVEKIRKALTEYTSDAFDYRPSSAKELLEASEHAANLLECCDLVPMAIPPTARIEAWRKMEKPPLAEIRRFAYELALELEKACQLL